MVPHAFLQIRSGLRTLRTGVIVAVSAFPFYPVWAIKLEKSRVLREVLSLRSEES